MTPALHLSSSDIASNCNAPLNQSELRSVTAVIAYIAYKQEVSEASVCAMLTTTFGVDDIKDLTANDYDNVIRFLVDLHLDEVMN